MTAKFIKVTEANGRECTVLLNVNCIASIQDGKDKDLYIQLSVNSVDKEGKPKLNYMFVKETMAEIEEMLK